MKENCKSRNIKWGFQCNVLFSMFHEFLGSSLMTLSVLTIWQTVGRLMSKESERIWKEAVVAYSRCLPAFARGLRKTMNNLSQDSQYPG
jgi:hypothetical protein